MTIVKTLAKGQIVIPAEIRRKIGLKPGRRVLVTLEGERKVSLEPLSDDPIRELRGILKGGPSLTGELLEERRKDRKREEEKFARFIRGHGMASKRKRGSNRRKPSGQR
jgi:AbrB family looped-hinge helix DNA binding protein